MDGIGHVDWLRNEAGGAGAARRARRSVAAGANSLALERTRERAVTRPSLAAAMSISLHFGCHWRRASEAER